MKQKPNRSRDWSRIFVKTGFASVLLTLLLIAVALLIGFVQLTWKEHQINQAIAAEEAEIAAQRTTNLQQQGHAEWIKSDMAVEQMARERLGMAREGETILRPNLVAPPSPTIPPVDQPPSPTTNPLPDLPQSATAANTVRWWRALFPGADAQP